jgi:hypothetical protein
VLVAGTDSTADLYSPATGTFSGAGQLLASASGFTATFRKDSTVLVAGGSAGGFQVSLAAAELFAPESGGFVATSSLLTARYGHTATLLVDGAVLITGGTNHVRNCGRGGCHISTTVLSSAELFK